MLSNKFLCVSTYIFYIKLYIIIIYNSKVSCQKISNVLMKTLYLLFLLTRQTTCLSFLRTLITNYWQTALQNHTKKSNSAAINNINEEAKCIAERLHLDDWIEKYNQRQSFVTLMHHKENFQNNPRCRLQL